MTLDSTNTASDTSNTLQNDGTAALSAKKGRKNASDRATGLTAFTFRSTKEKTRGGKCGTKVSSFLGRILPDGRIEQQLADGTFALFTDMKRDGKNYIHTPTGRLMAEVLFQQDQELNVHVVYKSVASAPRISRKPIGLPPIGLLGAQSSNGDNTVNSSEPPIGLQATEQSSAALGTESGVPAVLGVTAEALKSAGLPFVDYRPSAMDEGDMSGIPQQYVKKDGELLESPSLPAALATLRAAFSVKEPAEDGHVDMEALTKLLDGMDSTTPAAATNA